VDDTERAAVLLGAASELRSVIGVPIPASERQSLETLRAHLDRLLGPNVDQLTRRGALLSLDAAIAFAGTGQDR
jgi:hypothetical protein